MTILGLQPDLRERRAETGSLVLYDRVYEAQKGGATLRKMDEGYTFTDQSQGRESKKSSGTNSNESYEGSSSTASAQHRRT